MKIKFKEGTPKKWRGDNYIVKCLNYCESGIQIAKWDGTHWTNDMGDNITEWVTGWQVIDED